MEDGAKLRRSIKVSNQVYVRLVEKQFRKLSEAGSGPRPTLDDILAEALGLRSAERKPRTKAR